MRGDGGATALGEWRWCNAHAFNPHDIERVASAHRARALTLSDRRTPATGLRERVSQIGESQSNSHRNGEKHNTAADRDCRTPATGLREGADH
jgi:hypothetical protein